MSWINIKTEYSFRSVFAPVERIIELVVKQKNTFAGIADLNNTFGFVPWEKACIKNEIKPIFGVVLYVCPDLETKDRRGKLDQVTFIAKNQQGLVELNKLVETAHKQFWFTPRLCFDDLSKISSDVIVISNNLPLISPKTKTLLADYWKVSPAPTLYRNEEYLPISMIENNYILESDKATYETFADERLLERATYPQHILDYADWFAWTQKRKVPADPVQLTREALNNMFQLANIVDNVKLQKAPLVKHSITANPFDLEKKLRLFCNSGAHKMGVDLEKKKYKKRLEYELSLIKDKGFIDYFMIVADLIDHCKKAMLVGPGRGSSGGSLVCYLLGITTVDPLEYGLIFERFIDLNRTDLPDIDIDFQDTKRDEVLKYLTNKYNCCQIANISTLTPKINLNRTAKALKVPEYDLTELKNLTSDQKADAAKIKTLFLETEPGQALVNKYPAMADCIALEDMALHSSVHAAGIIVSNYPITNYTATINSRNKDENPAPVACLDMSGVEYLNMLKIDALGLQTLSVLADTLEQIGKPFSMLYDLQDGDKKTYELINSGRLTGVFQLEGRTIRGLLKKATMEEIEDLAAISALGRPGPMLAKSTAKYLKRKAGKEEITFPDKGKVIKKSLFDTYGVITYQEQIMYIARNYANMEWPDVINLRKVIGKSKGEEITKFREMFIEGATKAGAKKPEKVWEQIQFSGKYLFNKSHAIEYGVITYWCAYLKANYPLEFAVGLLNNTNDDNKAIHILRFLAEQEGIFHKDFDPGLSTLKWRVVDNILLGPLTSIHGIGIAGAKTIISCRKARKPIPAGIKRQLDNGISPFTFIYPRKQLYGKYKGMDIRELQDKDRDKATIVCKVISFKVKDANSLDKIKQRGKPVKGPTTYLSMIIADDTAEIMVIINRFEYKEIGKYLAEHAKEDKTWLQIKGDYKANMGLFFAKKIKIITLGE